MKSFSLTSINGILVSFLVCYLSCSNPKPIPYAPPSEVRSLVASDTGKVWMLAKRYNGKVRMNMAGCFLRYRQTFYKNQTVHDNNRDQSNCGQTLRGDWELTSDSIGNHYIKNKSEQYKRLMGRDSGYVHFKILYASVDSLSMSYSHNQFGTRRIITDYMVTENVNVPDRDFHW